MDNPPQPESTKYPDDLVDRLVDTEGKVVLLPLRADEFNELRDLLKASIQAGGTISTIRERMEFLDQIDSRVRESNAAERESIVSGYQAEKAAIAGGKSPEAAALKRKIAEANEFGYRMAVLAQSIRG